MKRKRHWRRSWVFRVGILLACASVAVAQSSYRWNDDPKVYKYSLVPGGVWSEQDAYDHGIESSSIAQLRWPIERYVSYIKDGSVYWTSQKLTIPAREYVWVHTGTILFRARCGNALSRLEQYPEEKLGTAPSPDEFDETEDLPGIDIPMQPFFDNEDVQLPPTQIARSAISTGAGEKTPQGIWPIAAWGAYPLVVGGAPVVVAQAAVPTPAPEPGVFGMVMVGLITGCLFWRSRTK